MAHGGPLMGHSPDGGSRKPTMCHSRRGRQGCRRNEPQGCLAPLFRACTPCLGHVRAIPVDHGRASPAVLPSFIASRAHAASGGGFGLSPSIRCRISTHRARGTRDLGQLERDIAAMTPIRTRNCCAPSQSRLRGAARRCSAESDRPPSGGPLRTLVQRWPGRHWSCLGHWSCLDCGPGATQLVGPDKLE